MYSMWKDGEMSYMNVFLLTGTVRIKQPTAATRHNVSDSYFNDVKKVLIWSMQTMCVTVALDI